MVIYGARRRERRREVRRDEELSVQYMWPIGQRLNSEPISQYFSQTNRSAWYYMQHKIIFEVAKGK
jgi:hypothetical protein